MYGMDNRLSKEVSVEVSWEKTHRKTVERWMNCAEDLQNDDALKDNRETLNDTE